MSCVLNEGLIKTLDPFFNATFICVFIDHVITMLTDHKFLFKEVESSGLIMRAGSSNLLCAFQSAFLEPC